MVWLEGAVSKSGPVAVIMSIQNPKKVTGPVAPLLKHSLKQNQVVVGITLERQKLNEALVFTTL